MDQPRQPTTSARPRWRSVARRVKDSFSSDNLTLVAAGVAFYGLLSLVPSLAAFVAIYGLAADPADVPRQVNALAGLPPEVRDVVTGQLQRIATTSDRALGVGLASSLAFALWSASKAMNAIITAMNIAYGVRETRGFVRRTALSLVFTAGAITAGVVAVTVIAGVPALVAYLRLPAVVEAVTVIVPWVALFAGINALFAFLYYYGPSRHRGSWQWISAGSFLATLLWVAMSMGFSIYVANFGNYNETYGSMGVVVMMLMWMWLSSLVVLLGAEVNAEVDRQTRPLPAPPQPPEPPEPPGASGAPEPPAPADDIEIRPGPAGGGPLPGSGLDRVQNAGVRS